MKADTTELPGPKVVRAKEETKRILVTSDIHGNLPLFRDLLERLEYRPGEDMLVVVGDLLEKGPDSLGTLRYAMELTKRGNVYVLCGNCDYASQDTPGDAWGHLNRWREKATHWQMGLEAGIPLPTGVEDVLAFRKKLEGIFPEENAFLRDMPQILETKRFLFAHAGLENEDLERQNLSFVLSNPCFPRETKHVFSKLLLVGHYPVSNLRAGEFDNAPLYHREQNVLSIDGGNMVKYLGQLNGVILDNETGSWKWTSANGFPQISVPCSQEEQAGVVIRWPDNEVEVVEQGAEISLCRHRKSGTLVQIPTDYLYEWNGGICTNDITDKRLALQKGEPVSLVREYEDRLLLLKNGKAGWLFL